MLLLVDLSYYWQHRFVHRARVAWAAHQAHHSSEYMNFGTALRQKWNPWFDVFFLIPLPFLGVQPAFMYIGLGINLIYQFFVHTETIDRLQRPIELVFNTPSHHRVHHGSDEIYLDRNYAGTLIIWDRMFGTFQPELHRPAYGLTHKVDTYNLVKLEYGHYADLWRDLKNATSWRHRLRYLFMPPAGNPPRAPPQSPPSPPTEESGQVISPLLGIERSGLPVAGDQVALACSAARPSAPVVKLLNAVSEHGAAHLGEDLGLMCTRRSGEIPRISWS